MVNVSLSLSLRGSSGFCQSFAMMPVRAGRAPVRIVAPPAADQVAGEGIGSSVIMARGFARDAAILERHLHDAAFIELTDRRAIQLLPWRGALRHGGNAVLLATCDFFVRD